MYIGWDTETFPIRPGLKAPPLVCVSWATPDGSSGVVPRSQACAFFLKYILPQRSIALNAPYDFAVMINEFPELTVPVFEAYSAGRVHDVGIRQKLADIAKGHRGFMYINGVWRKQNYSLSHLTQLYLGYERDKDDGSPRMQYGRLRDTPIEAWSREAYEYAVMDATDPLKIFFKQEESYRERGWLYDEAPQVRADFALHLLTCWGVAVNEEQVVRLDAQYAAEQEKLASGLTICGLLDGGSKVTAKAKELMKASLGYMCSLTDTGAKKVAKGKLTREQAIDAGYIALDEDSCRSSGHPQLKRYARYAHLQKLRGTYLEHLKGTPVVQPEYEVLVDSGRTSSRKPNIQNLPRETGPRECFIPRTGNVFVPCDFDKAELVTIAEVCTQKVGWSKLAEALNDGLDPHLLIASQMLHITYQEALHRKKDPDIKKARNMGKVGNFGLIGGLGVDKLVLYARANYGLEMTREEAAILKATWFKQWPEFHDYFRYVKGLLAGRKEVTVELLTSKRYRGRCRFTVLANTFMQSLCADGSKAAMWEVVRRQFCEPTSSLFKTRCAIYVHDELIPEAPESIGHEVAMELSQVMAQEYQKYTPHVKISASAHLMRKWSKEADEVWVNGRLIPWEDRPTQAA